MSRIDRKRRRGAFKDEETAMRRILNEWDPIPGSPVDEYDYVVHHLLSVLHSGASVEQVEDVLEHSFPNSSGVLQIAGRVMLWWEHESGNAAGE